MFWKIIELESQKYENTFEILFIKKREKRGLND
jgi:hypothetical protein